MNANVKRIEERRVDVKTWSLLQLQAEVSRDGELSCAALNELEVRVLDLQLKHKCDKPFQHGI